MRYAAILIIAFATAAGAQSALPAQTSTLQIIESTQPKTEKTATSKPNAPQVSSPGKPNPIQDPYNSVQIWPQKDAATYIPEKPRNVLALPWCKTKNCDFVTGHWTDTTLSMSDIWLSNKNEYLLINEDYEVVKTNEICATVRGLFHSQDNSVRYITYFHGARTSAEFIFTTRGSAESLAQRYCTPESLTNMINGTATTKREY